MQSRNNSEPPKTISSNHNFASTATIKKTIKYNAIKETASETKAIIVDGPSFETTSYCRLYCDLQYSSFFYNLLQLQRSKDSGKHHILDFANFNADSIGEVLHLV